MKMSISDWNHSRIFSCLNFPVSIFFLITFAASTDFLFLKRYLEHKTEGLSTDTKEAQKRENTINVFSIFA